MSLAQSNSKVCHWDLLENENDLRTPLSIIYLFIVCL